MNQYVTGAIIRELREKSGLTQSELAEKLYVSDKAVSKWENGKGYPDISLLEPIAAVFGISIAELVSGKAVSNVNVSANMLRSNSMSVRSAETSFTARARRSSTATACRSRPPCQRKRTRAT